ncbi:MAG: LysM domain-containing protein, partial [Acidobacteriota bacterium]
PWDGSPASGLPAAVQLANRNLLKTDLTTAIRDHLDGVASDVSATASLRRLPMDQFEGAGRAAKRVVDNRFSRWLQPVALTPTQEAARHNFQFRGSGPNQTLFDSIDPAQRSAAGMSPAGDPLDLASWIAETDTAAETVQASHNFDKNRSSDEEDFLINEVLNPFVADPTNNADLIRYDLFGGFAIAADQVVAPSTVTAGLSDVSPGSGVPSPAERSARWEMWKLLVHEYLHKVTHPAFSRAAGRNRIMTEGFTEMFTKETLQAELPGAPNDPAIRDEVEGGSFGAPPAGIVGGYSPGSYGPYLARAENVRDTAIGPPGGENAVKAAYFQGHVEFLGLSPAGAALAPRTTPPDEVDVPAGITTLAQLSTAANVSEDDIRAANSGLTAAGPLPARLRVPGAREHLVVEARNVVGSPEPTAETKDQIARQNGVLPANLERANPGVDWATLTEGQKILIPRH